MSRKVDRAVGRGGGQEGCCTEQESGVGLAGEEELDQPVFPAAMKHGATTFTTG